MTKKALPACLLFLFLFSTGTVYAYDAPVIVDHNHTDITQIPQAAIEQAKASLHIVYGHTSHGSQLTTGMTGLVAFANNGGLGLSLPTDIFAYNNGGTNGALDLHDGGMGGDVGYYPAWVNNTRNYLSNNHDVNVVIWSWCGQVDGKYANGTLHSEYLDPMNQLELDYPDVMFVYMTGHVDIWDDANNKAANQVIRDYCNANNKILYDFADIERYDPDGNYYEFVSDSCNYYERAGGSAIGNWATEWQNSHTEGVHWYNCYSAHSQPLNANRKAYAAWWLWARLGGWDGGNPAVCNNDGVCDADETYYSCPADCELCVEDWTCGDWSAWSECTDNSQSRTRTCTDTNDCGTVTNRPEQSETRICFSGESQIIDNLDDGYSDGGNWIESSGTNPFGSNSYYSITIGDTASWQTTILEAGQYEIYAWWSYHSNRHTAVPYSVYVNGSTTALDTTTVNQVENAGQWNLLGTYNFNAEDSVVVQVRTEASDFSTCADAVRFAAVDEASLADVILPLQVTAGLAPDGIAVENDVNGDGLIGLAEAISAINEIAHQ